MLSGHLAPTGVRDTHSRTRASQEPIDHHPRKNRRRWKEVLTRDAQAACDFSFSMSKFSPFFHSVRVMAAILRRWDYIWHPDAFWEHVGGVEGLHRQPWWSVVSREAERKSGWRLHFHGGAARWKRDDGGVAVHPDGAPRIHHRAERLHSRKDCSGTWDAIRFVVDFRTAQRQADCGRACGREASGYTRHASGRSFEGLCESKLANCY